MHTHKGETLSEATKDRITHTEEIELVRVLQSHKSDRKRAWAREKLVKANMGLVHKVVNKFPMRTASCSYDDLFQEGVGGIIHGLDKFDTTRGYRLSTYVYNWITAYVRRYFQNHGRTIRVPVHQCDKQQKLNREVEALCTELGRTPTSDEVAGIDENAHEVFASMMTISSLNSIIGDDDELDCIVGEDKTEEFESVVDCGILLEKVKDEVSTRDYQILVKRYGLEGETPLTLREVAEEYGVSRARVSQVEHTVLGKLRECVN